MDGNAWQPPKVTEYNQDGVVLRWVIHDDEQPAHHLYDGEIFVGEVYGVDRDNSEPIFRWHCKVTDWRNSDDNFCSAKNRLLENYRRHLSSDDA